SRRRPPPAPARRPDARASGNQRPRCHPADTAPASLWPGPRPWARPETAGGRGRRPPAFATGDAWAPRFQRCTAWRVSAHGPARRDLYPTFTASFSADRITVFYGAAMVDNSCREYTAARNLRQTGSPAQPETSQTNGDPHDHEFGDRK